MQEEPHYLDETLLEPTIALAALAMVVVVQSRVSTPEPGLPEGVRHALETIATETSSSAADLRQLLSTLREDSPASTTPDPLSDADTLRAEVAAQAERLRAAGFVPEVTVALTTVSTARSTTLAKTVVEGVNNMMKHVPRVATVSSASSRPTI